MKLHEGGETVGRAVGFGEISGGEEIAGGVGAQGRAGRIGGGRACGQADHEGREESGNALAHGPKRYPPECAT